VEGFNCAGGAPVLWCGWPSADLSVCRWQSLISSRLQHRLSVMARAQFSPPAIPRLRVRHWCVITRIIAPALAFDQLPGTTVTINQLMITDVHGVLWKNAVSRAITTAAVNRAFLLILWSCGWVGRQRNYAVRGGLLRLFPLSRAWPILVQVHHAGLHSTGRNECFILPSALPAVHRVVSLPFRTMVGRAEVVGSGRALTA
jgi:hypothetical protein